MKQYLLTVIYLILYITHCWCVKSSINYPNGEKFEFESISLNLGRQLPNGVGVNASIVHLGDSSSGINHLHIKQG